MNVITLQLCPIYHVIDLVHIQLMRHELFPLISDVLVTYKQYKISFTEAG